MDFSNGFNLKISDKEYNLLVALIYDRSGINLGSNKKELVKARLNKRIKALNLNTFKEYYEYVVKPEGEDELVEMLNAISTNVTSFFRENSHFDFMTKKALPEIVERKTKSGEKRIRIWSSACSTGEEVYTILITVLEYIKDPRGWDIKVLGTDISTKALALARNGVYDKEKISNIPGLLVSKYFDIHEEKGEKYYKVKEEVQRMGMFTRLNLMDKVFPFRNKIDIIFCRNVMIYFDKQTQTEVVKKFEKYLDEGGYLFIGHSESLIGMDIKKLKCMQTAVYKKIE